MPTDRLTEAQGMLGNYTQTSKSEARNENDYGSSVKK